MNDDKHRGPGVEAELRFPVPRVFDVLEAGSLVAPERGYWLESDEPAEVADQFARSVEGERR